MKGNIYAKHPNCPCGGRFANTGRRVQCDGCERPYSGTLVVKFGRDVRRLFGDYHEAERFLNVLRFDTDRGRFDPRDHQKVSPLAIGTLADRYLAEKIDRKTYKDITRFMHQFVAFVGEGRNVKDIRKPEIKRFLYSIQGISEKTRSGYRTTVHDFLCRWCVEEEVLARDQAPEVPRVRFELGWRKITDWQTQAAIVDKVREIAPARVWLGIDLLRTYPALRPGDLLRIREQDIGQEIILWNPTKLRNKRKVIRLLAEHADLVAEQKRMHPALPSVCFFRHVETRAAGQGRKVRIGDPFARVWFWTWWKRACAALSVVGLDLYGGTRHTTVSSLAVVAGTDAARDASMHETRSAFDRYCQTQELRAYEMAKLVRCHQGATVIPLPDKASG